MKINIGKVKPGQTIEYDSGARALCLSSVDPHGEHFFKNFDGSGTVAYLPWFDVKLVEEAS